MDEHLLPMQLHTLDQLQALMPVGWFVSFQQGSFHVSQSGLSEQEVRQIASALNSHRDLLDSLKNLYEIRNKQWRETAEIQFAKGRTLLPWPDLQQAEAAIRKAERPAE